MVSQEQLEKDLKYLVCGGVSGMISRTAVAPLERLKILLQVQDMMSPHTTKYAGGVVSSLRQMLREESWRGFFKGNGANCLRVFPYIATQFFVFEKLKQHLPQVETSVFCRLMAGAMAGVTSVAVTYPLDFARARLTVLNLTSNTATTTTILQLLKHQLQSEGWRGLYRGITPTVCGVAPYVGLNFMVFETLKDLAPPDKYGKPDLYYLLAFGAIAGACGQTAAYPFDLLRRRFQLTSVSKATTHQYETVIGSFRNIIVQEGFLGLYKGIWPNFIKVVPSIAVMFVSNEAMKRVVM